MKLWRLVRAKWAGTALDGEGARIAGGRWNPPGVAVVYTSASLSLAALEALVRANRAELPTDLIAVRIAAPDALAVFDVEPSSLPSAWRAYPAPDELASIGARWIREGRSALLRVPSAVVPSETNVLVNPAHRDARRLVVEATELFAWGERLS